MEQSATEVTESPTLQLQSTQDGIESHIQKRAPLTTKQAMEFVLSGELRFRVCRFCLYVTYSLQDLDCIIQLASGGAIYKVTIREMLATVHPSKVDNVPDYPSKICDKCLDTTIHSYLFAQQCDQSERALQNCFDDISNKLDKLDPLGGNVKKRGRHKVHPNHNIIHAEHKKVSDYAEPAHHLTNHGTVFMKGEPEINKLECKKCWQLLPDMESLAYHTKLHPKSMWYRCRLCAKSFVRVNQYNDHVWLHRKENKQINKLPIEDEEAFKCLKCHFSCHEFKVHLQHIEKHKFKTVLEHLFEEKDMNKLCAVCLNPNGRLESLDNMVSLHGGYPEMSGDRTLYNILGSTIPELNFVTNYTSTNICDKCIELAITSYIFIYRTHFTRLRLSDCLTSMLKALDKVREPSDKLLLQIDQNSVLPINKLADYDANLLLDPEEIDESKLDVEFLEDEFRLPDTNRTRQIEVHCYKTLTNGIVPLINGIKNASGSDICTKFLSYNKSNNTKLKSLYTCPLCYKHFVSAYFLKKDVFKHVNKNVQCSVCSEQFINKFHLHEHKKMVHLLGHKLYNPCEVCGRTFTSELKKQSHKRLHEAQVCPLCFKDLKHGQHNSHMQKHAMKFFITASRSVLKACGFCDKIFASFCSYEVHMRKVHFETKAYDCNMCEKQFYARYLLKQHKKIHSIRKSETCVLCDKTVSSRRDLVNHIRKHALNGVKQFKCQMCLWRFYTEMSAIAHIKKWHGVDVNKCRYVLSRCS